MDYKATVRDDARCDVGAMEFRIIETDHDSFLMLTWAYLDLLDPSYRFQGIGRECLRRVKERSGMVIVAQDDDGQRRGDGSHLTGDAALSH
jgi:hypothetical protein